MTCTCGEFRDEYYKKHREEADRRVEEEVAGMTPEEIKISLIQHMKARIQIVGIPCLCDDEDDYDDC